MLVNHFFQLVFVLTKKEIKARYKNAILGFLWVFINPIVQMLVMGFVFSLIFEFDISNYYLFLFTGLIPWNFFSMAINKATPRIVWDRNLIQKAKFPREVIPLSMVFSHLFHFIISWSLLIIFLLITQGWYFFSITAILQQIIGIVLLLIFASGISLITSALTVFYRDIKFMVQLGIMLWFYATPVIYPFTQIPNQYQWIFYLNPLTGIFSLLKQPITEHSLPLVIVTGQAIFIFIVLLLGITIFRKREKFFADYL